MERANPSPGEYVLTGAMLTRLLVSRRRQLILLLLTAVLLVLARLLLLPAAPVVDLLLWLVFAGIFIWSGILLRDALFPEQLIYYQLATTCSQLARDTSDPELLLDRLTHALYTNLRTKALTLWRYDDADSVLHLLRAEGVAPPADLAELPVDISHQQLSRAWSVTELPESALKQGLHAAGARFLVTLNTGNTFVGFIGTGELPAILRFARRRGQWLGLLGGSLAPIIQNTFLASRLMETLENLHLAYRRTIDAQEDERRSLATELHDDILGRLTTMALTLHQSQQHLQSRPVEVHGWLDSLESETQAINRRLREITQGLHPSVLSDLGLISAVLAYMDSLARQPGQAGFRQTITLTAQGFSSGRIGLQKLERDLYYITKQALDNAITHARAEQIFIHLRWDEAAISLTVRDTGQGMPGNPDKLVGLNGHLGLLSMHERALAWRGTLSLHTTPGQGTTVRARLPVDQPSYAPAHMQAHTQYLN